MARRRDPSRRMATLVRALERLLADDLTGGRRLLESLHRDDPGDVRIAEILAGVRESMGDQDGAVDLLGVMREADPEYFRGYLHNHGNRAREEGHLEHAAEVFESILEEDPDFAPSLLGRGQVEISAGRPKDAVPWFRRSVAADPDFAPAWHALGDAYDRMEQVADAMDAFTRGWSAARDPGCARRLAVLQAVHGRPAVAVALLKGVLARAPDDAVCGHLLAALTGEVPDEPPDAWVVELFDAYADGFDAHLTQTLGYRAPDALFDALEAVCPGRTWGRVADLGCGTGLMGVRLAERAGTLHGVDLSARMVKQAVARGIYASVDEGVLQGWLAAQDDPFDLLVAADVFGYVGRLEPVLAAVSARLAPNGRVAFTTEVVEGAPDDAFDLGPTGRYRHGPAGVDAAAAAAGLAVERRTREILRTEGGRPVFGDVVVLRAPP